MYKYTKIHRAIELLTVIKCSTHYQGTIDTILEAPFIQDAIIYCQKWNDTFCTKFYAANITKILDAHTFEFHIISGSDTPSVGDMLVWVGHVSDPINK